VRLGERVEVGMVVVDTWVNRGLSLVEPGER